MRFHESRQGLLGLVALVALVPLACSDEASTSAGTTSTSGTGGSGGTTNGTGAMGGTGGSGGSEMILPTEDLGRDILHTALAVDLATRTATATITMAASAGTGASFEVAGLSVNAVKNEAGPLLFAVNDGRLDVGVPAGATPATVIVEYGFEEQDLFEGLMANGATLVWPYWCGNLFPCHSDPADGTTFALAVTGTPEGQTTVYPADIPVDAPSYQIAWATGEYTALDLGTTLGGTHLTAYSLPGGEDAAQVGTAPLLAVFEWYETTYGPYPFGPEAGAVSVQWGPTAYGGMEHHPLWHVGSIAMKDPWIHAHEAAHGWFGDGVRMACWEDLVLSEGTVSYLEARAVTAVMGELEGGKLWDHYQGRLDKVAAKVAWPDGCGQVDVLKDGLFGDAPYMKGAYFFRALEGKIGTAVLDAALAKFFAQWHGKAARFSDLLAEVEGESGYDASPCAASWLKATTVPAETVCP